MTHTVRRRLFVPAILLMALLPGALTPVHSQDNKDKKPKKGAPAKPSGPPVWPLPPEKPRIRFLTAYHGVDDFKTRKTPRWKTALLGDEDPSQNSDRLVKPYGVAVSPDGLLYVADTAARRVFVFDADHKVVSFLGDKGNGKLTKPVGVAVAADGKVFVADATLNRVFGYGVDGNVAIAIGRDGEMKSPSGLAIDRAHELLYVADSAKHQILCYSTADGSRVRTIGERGGDPGNFNFPTNLFVDAAGRLYVADTLNFRIQIFDADGKFLKTFGTQGDTPGTFNRPKGIAVDSEGHIYVADTSFNNFQIFDEEGELLLFVGTAGRASGEFLLPAGMYIDALDRVYVADQGNSRVQVFRYEKTP